MRPITDQAGLPSARRLAVCQGFTLTELVMVLALMVILAGLAAPGFRSLLVKRAVRATADALVGDLRFARAEAVKRAVTVAVCASADGQACAGAGPNWAAGWIVFVDRNANRLVDSGEEIMRAQARPEFIGSIASLKPESDRSIFSYQPTGWAKVATQTFYIAPSALQSSAYTRLVCVSNQGRPSLRPEGTDACS